MKILKPKKSKFDEDLASRINKEKIVKPTVEELINFCGTQIYSRELEALKEVYAMFGKQPEEEYLSDNSGDIRIKEGHLYHLYLRDEGLSSLPNSVGNWIKLNSIHFEYNQLATLPESVGNWTDLDYIVLDNNQLTSLPESVGNWVNLSEINLAKNKLTRLPDSVGNWKKLRRIYLQSNPIAEDEKYIAELQRKLPQADIITK